ncbi:DUF4144 family protein [Neptuniibacter sp. PT8_73]|uniref:DUF4144 family protein n=1 Tax=Neptuniibacter sp. PT8_73 TaxID=3398206 RepID=UPI0039F4DAE3
MTKWPAIIKYRGESELTYIDSGSEWDCDADLHFFRYDSADQLIDSEGNIFSLVDMTDNFVKPRAINCSVSKETMQDLIRAHFSSIGECCVSKFSIGSIAEGITTVGQFEES